MDKVLFISNNAINYRTFSNALSGQFETDIAKYGEVSSVDDCKVVICDVENDPACCLKEINSLREIIGFRDVPVLIAITPANKSFVRNAGHVGAVGVIMKPFESRTCASALSKSIAPVGTKCPIKMEVVMPFINGAVEVIEKMAKEQSTRQSMFLKANYAMFGDVSGLMGLSGETEGVVAVAFHQDLAFRLVGKMVGCDEDELSVEEVNDGIGEIINMIAGSAKRSLSETDYAFSISLPTVITGRGHRISHQSTKNVPVIVMVFECAGMPFAIQLCISSATEEESNDASDTESVNKKLTPSAI